MNGSGPDLWELTLGWRLPTGQNNYRGTGGAGCSKTLGGRGIGGLMACAAGLSTQRRGDLVPTWWRSSLALRCLPDCPAIMIVGVATETLPGTLLFNCARRGWIIVPFTAPQSARRKDHKAPVRCRLRHGCISFLQHPKRRAPGVTTLTSVLHRRLHARAGT